MRKIDPFLPFKIGPVNEREARESGLWLKAWVAAKTGHAARTTARFGRRRQGDPHLALHPGIYTTRLGGYLFELRFCSMRLRARSYESRNVWTFARPAFSLVIRTLSSPLPSLNGASPWS
jgi:hypothetical protein